MLRELIHDINFGLRISSHAELMKQRYKRRKTVTARVTDTEGKRTWWLRSELKQLLGRSAPMSEATFKRRLQLLEEYCPETERKLYARKFPDFTKWALLKIESWLSECNWDLAKIQQKLEIEGLPTDEYFTDAVEE